MKNCKGFWYLSLNDAIMQIAHCKGVFIHFLSPILTEYSASGSGEGWESGSGSASGSSGDSGDWEEYSGSGKRAWSDDEDL